jgi:cysteine desulfurase
LFAVPAAVYLDHHATTPLDARALDAMLPFLRDGFGNPSSPHDAGRRARAAIDEAREQIGPLVAARGGEVILTSGATEANNLALFGAVRGGHRTRVISSEVEHPSILRPLEALRRVGSEVVLLPVDRNGRVDPERLAQALSDDTALVTLAAANGEIGTLENVAALAEITHRHGALFHSDATQAVGTEQIAMHDFGIDMLSVSAHKIRGPQGNGALIASSEVRRVLRPILYGGGQENGQRSGTVNVAGAVGFGAAAAVTVAERDAAVLRVSALRDHLLAELEREVAAQLNGPRDRRLASNLNVRIPGVLADALLATCDAVQFSAGSACSSGTPGPSPVLIAIGVGDEAAEESVRFGLGYETTRAEIDLAARELISAAHQVRDRRIDPAPVMAARL